MSEDRNNNDNGGCSLVIVILFLMFLNGCFVNCGYLGHK